MATPSVSTKSISSIFYAFGNRDNCQICEPGTGSQEHVTTINSGVADQPHRRKTDPRARRSGRTTANDPRNAMPAKGMSCGAMATFASVSRGSDRDASRRSRIAVEQRTRRQRPLRREAFVTRGSLSLVFVNVNTAMFSATSAPAEYLRSRCSLTGSLSERGLLANF